MKLGNNFIRDLRFLLGCFIGPKKKKCFYLGHTGFKNLGDEALRLAIYELFSKYFVMTEKKGLVVRCLQKLGFIAFDVLMLGGGTLLLRSEKFLALLEADGFSWKVVFGTGVANPIFWEHVPGNYGESHRWRKCLEQVDYLSVRGPISEKVLKEKEIRRSVEVIGDPVLYFSRPLCGKKTLSKRMGVNVGVTGGEKKRELLWGMNEKKFFSVFASFLELMVDDGWEIEFIPVCKEDLPSIWDTLGLVGGEKKIGVFHDYMSVESVLDRMETFDVFVGQKLHSVVLAYCANTPAIMVEYRPKCRDFMESIQMSEFNIRTDEFDAYAVKSLVCKLYDNIENYREKSNEICLNYKKRLVGSAEKVSRILSRDEAHVIL